MNKTCENCPARLLNEDEVISNNIGNICSKVLYVFPRYDEEAIKDLKEIYSLATGKNLKKNVILPMLLDVILVLNIIVGTMRL